MICSSQETCLDWLKSRGLIPKMMFCPNCSKKMRLETHESSVDNYKWICKDCQIDPPCYSVRHGSWLENREAPLVDVLLFTYLWTNGFSESQIAKETNMSIEIVRDWNRTYSNICDSIQRKSFEENEMEEERNFKNTGKETPTSAWKKKSKCKDPFLEFLKDADSL